MTSAALDLAAVGRALIAAGLTPRALELWSGTATLSHLRARLPAMSPNPAPAAFALELFVAGRAAPTALVRARLGEALPALLALGLLVEEGEQVRAAVSVLPVSSAASAGRRPEPALAVCNRLDAEEHRDSTQWPDGSTHHLCGALQGLPAVERWLDLGTGSGIAPLVHRQLAQLTVGSDLVVPTARCAALGAALSDHRRFHVVVGDLDDAIAGQWDLVTCNAPIPLMSDAEFQWWPSEPGSESKSESASGSESGSASGSAPATDSAPLPLWCEAEADFLERLLPRLPGRVRPGGLTVLHTHHGALMRALPKLGGFAALGGHAITLVYTPVGVPPFAITWWQPHLPANHQEGALRGDAGHLVAHRPLTVERPYVDERDRHDAAENRLPPLPEAADSLRH